MIAALTRAVSGVLGKAADSAPSHERRRSPALMADVVATFAIRVTAAFAVYMTQVVIARWMGPGELGAYVYAYSWCVLFAIFTTFGMPIGANRHLAPAFAAGDRAQVLGYVRRSRQVALSFGTLFAAAAIGYMALRHEVAPSPMTIALLAVPMFAFITLHQDIARAHLWHRLASITGLLSRPLLFFLAIVAGWLLGLPPAASFAMWLLLASALVVALVQHVIVQRRLRAAHGSIAPTYQTRRWLHAGAIVLMIELSVTYLPEISIVVIGSLLPPDEVAVFSAALRTVSLINFAIAAVATIIGPHLAHLVAVKDTAGMQRLVTRAAALMFLPSVAFLGALALFGDLVLNLFGARFQSGYAPMLVLGAGQVAASAAGPLMTLVVVGGNQARYLWVLAVATAACVVLNIAVVPQYGIMGAAGVYCAVTVGWALAVRTLIVRHLGIEPSLASLLIRRASSAS
ncbi:MAG: lipopolysaccharide biosynthesis protein [Rhodospirillaceae bacterium]